MTVDYRTRLARLRTPVRSGLAVALAFMPAWLALERGQLFAASLVLSAFDALLFLRRRTPLARRVLPFRYAVIGPLVLALLTLYGAPGAAVYLAASFTILCLLQLGSARIAMPLAAAGMLLSLAPRPHVVPRDQLVRFATYNLEYARLGPAPLAQAIESLDADVVAVEEVVVDERDGKPFSLFPVLERLTGMRGQWIVGSVPFHDEMGSGILSRWPMDRPEVLRLPDVPGAPGDRLAIKARVHVRGRSIMVAAAHLDRPPYAGPRDQERQVRAVEQWLQGEKTVLLGGDFNGFPIYPGYGVLQSSFTDVRAVQRWPSGSWPRPLGLFRIDWIFARGLTPIDQEVVRCGPSDHYPVVASLRLPVY